MTPEDFAAALSAERSERQISDAARFGLILSGKSLDEWLAEREWHEGRFDNLKHPEWCDRCREPFELGDVIHREYARYSDTSWLLPYCERCIHESWREVAPEPCVTCGRPVVDHRRYRSWRYRYLGESYTVACGRRCAARAATVRRRVRHEPRACAFCSEDFTPKRSDAQYCSPACRQRAHRDDRAAGTT